MIIFCKLMIVVKFMLCHATNKIDHPCHMYYMNMSVTNITSWLKEPLIRRFLVYFRFDQLSLRILTRLYTKYALVSPRKILICTFSGINFMEVGQNNNFNRHNFLLCS